MTPETSPAAPASAGDGDGHRGGLVALGETMALLTAPAVGRLRHAASLTLGIGGAESNVAIGVRRLGLPAAWVGRVGADEFGELVVGRIRGEGVDVSGVVRDPQVPTGLMVKERRTTDVSRVTYYRAGGPGARLRPDDLNPGRIAAAGALHVTGITPALSDSARATVRAAVETANAAGVPVSLDINYRAALWDAAEAGRALRDLAATCDIVFAGLDEAALLGAEGEPEQAARGIAGLGPTQVLIKLGARGAVACVDGRVHRVAPVPVTVVDPVGAGDAFVAGYLTEVLCGAPVADRLATAAACGALAVTTPGDWEGLPTREELALVSLSAGTVVR